MMAPANSALAPLVILAAGGTGGHVVPAQALAAELAAHGCRLALVTDRRGGDVGGRLGELPIYRIQAAGVAGKSLVNRVFSTGELAIGTLQAWQLLKKLAPAAVVGFGGYASVPTMAAASLLGLHTAIHEQNAVLGRANRLLASRVEAIATCYETVKGVPEGAASRVVMTGMPVRPEVIAMRDRDWPQWTDDGPIRLLVMGGSQGAAIFSRILPPALERLDPALRGRLALTQQCRAEDLEGVRAAYARLDIAADLAPFFDDVPRRIAEAHLVISRAGASSIAEITAIGRPAILVPYPHAVDDHQSFNAHAVDAAAAGWLIPDEAFSAEALAARLAALFARPNLLEMAAKASKAVGNPDAGGRLADLVMGLIGRNGGTEDRKEAA